LGGGSADFGMRGGGFSAVPPIPNDRFNFFETNLGEISLNSLKLGGFYKDRRNLTKTVKKNLN
jgi:hypothetical protein